MAPRKGQPPADIAKKEVLSLIAAGVPIAKAMARVKRHEQAFYDWKKRDSQFRANYEKVKSRKWSPTKELSREERAGSFEYFRREYLGMRTFLHQAQWIDLIEGREPRNLHPAMRYEPGDPGMVLINTAPEHSKTITLSVDYVTYRLCKDLSLRVILVSKTQEMAKQFLYAIKQRLTNPTYAKLQAQFAPPEGFNGTDSVWQSNLVYISGSGRDGVEKDPTFNAIGIGGQIYGARADLILLDDCVVLSNANAFESHIRWVQQEVLTRLGPGGRLIVAGTRVDSVDLYRELRNPERYPDGKSPWTYLAQPAVLEFADKPEDWVTLWPKSDKPWAGTNDEADEDGLYPRWDGKRLSKRRGVLDPKTWSMVYMQQEVAETSVFDAKDVRACVNGARTVGPMNARLKDSGGDVNIDKLYVVCAMDPAMAGETASIAYAVDMDSNKRYVLDAHRMRAPTPGQIRDIIKTWTEKYLPQSWIVEKNAFQLFLTRDEEIRSYLASRGVAMLEHYTGSNKLDPDFGVASLGPLFTERMIELPSSHNCEGVKALIEQLITWVPGVKGSELKQDLPMALWFAEIKAREVCNSVHMRHGQHWASKYLPRYRRDRQMVVSLDDYMTEEPSVFAA